MQTQGMWSEGLGTPVMSATEIMGVLRSLGMAKFSAAVMWVINEVFVGEHENENGGRQQEQLKTTFCPQADFEGEQLLINDERLMIIRGCCVNRMRLKGGYCWRKLCKAETSGNMTLVMQS